MGRRDLKSPRKISPALWAEEYITWLAISEGSSATPKIEAQLRGALEAFRQGRRGIADWFSGAYGRLPEEVRSTDAAWELLQATRPEVRLAVHRRERILEIGDLEPRDGAAAILVPDTDPTVIELTVRGKSRTLAIDRGDFVSETVGFDHAKLRTAGGLVYHLEGVPPPQPSTGGSGGRIFMSHAARDSREAVALRKWLSDRDPSLANDIFLDANTGGGIRPGVRWKDALRQASERCEAVICLMSRAYEESPECLTEFRTAENLNKRIFVVRLEPATGERVASDWQWIDLFGSGPMTEIEIDDGQSPVTFPTAGLHKLSDGVTGAGIGAETFVWPPPNDPDRSPYRGWEPLQEMDAAVFFGRDAQILRGLDEFRGLRQFGETRMLVILGPSGAGKSSFLRAGLLPRLRRDDRDFAVLEVVRPGRDVLTGATGLAQSLHITSRRLGIKAHSIADIKQACLSDTNRVRELLSDIRAAAASRLLWVPEGVSPPTLVLPVDQAEELFSVDAEPEAQRFLEMIGEFADEDVERGVQLILAVTIRTDRHELLQTSPQLLGVRSVIFDDLKPLPLSEFRQVIEGPARRAVDAGRPLRIEPALVDRLLADCTGGADTLPLLSLTLARLYTDYGTDGDLTLREYEAMGAVRNVAQTEVDRMLSTDPATRRDQLTLLREAFIPALATINPDDDIPTRRVARWDELPAESLPLLEKFVDSRLLVRDDRTGGNVVEIALESLLRNWDELREWLEEERESMRSAEVLMRDAREWERNGRDDAWLLQGTRLANAEVLLAMDRFGDYLSSAREFVEASRRRESPRRRFNPGNWIRRNR